MKKTLIPLLISAFGLAGCAGMSSDQRYATGALAGGAAGLALADNVHGSGTEKAIGALAGAAIGGAVASNTVKQCRYADGTIRACPAGY